MRQVSGAQALRELRRAVSWHRGLIAAGLAAATVALSLSALAPKPPPRTRVLAAAHDLAAGAALSARDLATVALPPTAVPAGVLRPGAAVLGRLLAGPVRRGEPLTDVRLVGPRLLAALGDGLVATPVRIADPGAVALLRAGDRVDVLAAATSQPDAAPASVGAPAGPSATDPVSAAASADGGGARSATVVAAGVAVVSVPAPGQDGPLADGALVVLATSPEVAARLAAAAVSDRLSVLVRGAA